MKTSVKIFSIVSIMALVSLFISNAGAQVVTPSLNPMAPVDMAAAAGWRTIPTVGISYFDSIGNRSYNGENIYEFTGSGTMANLSFKAWERFAFEGFYYADTTTVAKDEYYDGVINLKTADTRLNFSLAHGDFVVFGLAMNSLQKTEYINATYPEEAIKLLGTNPSLAIKLGSSFYFGGGIERIKENSSYMVNNHWINTAFGLAIMTEKDDNFMFRLEASMNSSPKSEATAKLEKEASSHNKTSVTRICTEMKMQGLVFSVDIKDTKESVNLTNPVTDEEIDTIHTVNAQVGFLISPKEGIVIGFLFKSDKTDQVFSDKKDAFLITVAYNFGE